MLFPRPVSLQRVVKLTAIFLSAVIIRQMMHYRSTSSREAFIKFHPEVALPELPQLGRFALTKAFKSTATTIKTTPVSRESRSIYRSPTSASRTNLASTTPRATPTSRLPATTRTTLPAFQQRAIDRVMKVRFYEQFVTDNEYRIMMNLLETIDRVFRHYNTTYMIYGGTLLGSHRHHGFIPWDDDIDLLVNKTCRSRITMMLKNLAPDLTLYEAGGHDKICHALSVKTSPYSWRWPYLDVSYFEENSTHLWDHTQTYSRWFVYPKYLTLPTHLRPFDRMWLPAPRDTLAFLQLTYGRTGTCLTSGYSHMIENGMPSDRRLCSVLKDKVTFVHRRPCSNNATSSSTVACIRESLQLGKKLLQTLLVNEPSYAINEPYSLKLTGGFTQPQGYPAFSDTDL